MNADDYFETLILAGVEEVCGSEIFVRGCCKVAVMIASDPVRQLYLDTRVAQLDISDGPERTICGTEENAVRLIQGMIRLPTEQTWILD